MSRLSSVETRIPSETRRQLNRLLVEGRTYDEISAWAETEGLDLSRSAIGRYGAKFREIYRQVLQFDEQAEALVTEAGGDGMVMDEAVSRLIMRQLMSAMLDGQDILENPALMNAFANLQKANLQRERFKTAFREAAVKAVERVAGETRMDADALKKVREALYGV